MIKKTKYLSDLLFGKRDSITSQRYFVRLATFIAAIFSLNLGFFHILSSLNSDAVILALTTACLLFVLYAAVRFYSFLLVPKIVLTIGGLVILDVAFYIKYLSNGPILLFILIFSALILLLWDGKALMLLLVFYFLNLCVLFYIDYTAATALFEYPSEQQRSIDIFTSFFIYTMLLVSLLYIFKLDFLEQKKKAIQSDKLKSAFLANMSHEIRTPMNGILGFSDLLRNPNLSGTKQQEYIEIIDKSGHRMLNVINDIIDISQIESGLLKATIEPVSIRRQLDYLYTLFKADVEAKGMQLRCLNLEETEEVVVITDEAKLLVILSNLIKNAIKYSKQGAIEFGYVVKGNCLEFYVKDNGIGIVTERQNAIFERFVQADIDDVQARQGAGLGLSITKAYVELLGGNIWVESEFGAGSKFSFSIPL